MNEKYSFFDNREWTPADELRARREYEAERKARREQREAEEAEKKAKGLVKRYIRTDDDMGQWTQDYIEVWEPALVAEATAQATTISNDEMVTPKQAAQAIDRKGFDAFVISNAMKAGEITGAKKPRTYDQSWTAPFGAILAWVSTK